jgi:hypothetical protein
MNQEAESHHPGVSLMNQEHAKWRKSWLSILTIQGK